TSPPKSAWPGVSTMLILTSLYTQEQFLARMVMPRSRSMSPESITRSATCWLARNAPDCLSIWSTRVVLPWSTWAIMAMLRRFSRIIVSLFPLYCHNCRSHTLQKAPESAVYTYGLYCTSYRFVCQESQNAFSYDIIRAIHGACPDRRGSK